MDIGRNIRSVKWSDRAALFLTVVAEVLNGLLLELKRFKQRETLAQPRATSWRAACQCSVSLEHYETCSSCKLLQLINQIAQSALADWQQLSLKSDHAVWKYPPVKKFRFHTGYPVNNLQTKINCLAVVWFIRLEIIILVCGLKCQYVYYKSLRCVAQKEDIVKTRYEISKGKWNTAHIKRTSWWLKDLAT